eukprot:15430338-Alexandrium_andersonii.AAC.1
MLRVRGRSRSDLLHATPRAGGHHALPQRGHVQPRLQRSQGSRPVRGGRSGLVRWAQAGRCGAPDSA